MAQLLLNDDIKVIEDSFDDIAGEDDDLLNYKGAYQNEDDDSEPKYFEGGAHFPYTLLCQRLDSIIRIAEKKQSTRINRLALAVGVELSVGENVGNRDLQVDSISQSFQGIFIFIKT